MNEGEQTRNNQMKLTKFEEGDIEISTLNFYSKIAIIIDNDNYSTKRIRYAFKRDNLKLGHIEAEIISDRTAHPKKQKHRATRKTYISHQ